MADPRHRVPAARPAGSRARALELGSMGPFGGFGGSLPARFDRGAPRPAPTGRVVTPWSYPLLMAFLLLMFSNIAVLYPQLAPLAPAQLAALGALTLLVAERTVARAGIRLVDPESYLLIALLGVALVSSFTALWPRYALENTAEMLKFAVVYLLLINTVESWRRFDLTLRVLVVGGLFPAIGALHHLAIGRFVEGSRVAWVGIFGNPNDLAYTMALLVPLSALLAVESRGLWRLAFWAATGLFVVAAFATYSRGGMLGLAAVGGLFFVCFTRGVRRLAGLAFGALLAVGMATMWDRDAGFESLSADATVLERLATIRGGLGMFADQPFFGVGPGNSILGWETHAPDAVVGTTKWLHVHNTYVQTLAEVGLLGAAAFFGFLGFALLRCYRMARRWHAGGQVWAARRATALAISMVGFLVCGLSGGHLFNWFPYLLVGLISALHLLPEPSTQPTVPSTQSSTLPLDGEVAR